MALLTTKQVIVRIIVIIAIAEFLIMLLLQANHHQVGSASEAVLDTFLLVVFTTPAIYFWVIKPFVAARDDALGQISKLAHTDPLTQLANRRLILVHLRNFVSSNARHKDYGALLLIDLDGFKLVNDIHGHEAGDAVLVEIAERLQSIIRAEDVVGRMAGRLGGDEFIVLIHRLGSDEQLARDRTVVVAEKLINAINKPVNFNGNLLQVGASIGIRLLGLENLDIESAISEADIALYNAKTTGKGRAIFYQG